MQKTLWLVLFTLVVGCSNQDKLLTFDGVENDFVDPSEFSNEVEARYAPFVMTDPETQPRDGETQADVDRRLGPWLNLQSGGVAVGAPQGIDGAWGTLIGGTQLPPTGPGYMRVSGADSVWGTGFMVSLIQNSAAAIAAESPGLIVRVGDIAREAGGHFHPPHKSHQNGLDADILYMGSKSYESVVNADGSLKANFDFEKNWRYWQLLTAQKYANSGRVESIVSMILVSPEIKKALCVWAEDNARLQNQIDRDVMRRIRPTAGHSGHFHVRLRCSPYHLNCVKSYGPGAETGCEV